MHLLKSMVLAIMLVTAIPGCGQTNSDSRWLHTRGQDIINGNGQKILLRGVGLGNWLLPEGYMWKFGPQGDRPRKIEKLVSDLLGDQKAAEFWRQFRSNYITEADIRRIAELGFNAVRPALNSRLFLTEGENAHFIEGSFTLIDSLVDWCEKYGIYVIIDIHGAPGGQTGANIDDSPNDEPELFMVPRNMDRLEALWVKIAERYKNEPAVAAYNLINEPLPRRTGAADKYGHMVLPLYKRLIAAIRKVDQRHMITVEGIDWANDWSIFGEQLDDNLFYQFHYYCWNRPDNLNDISHFLKHRERLQAPVWVGETGEKGNTIYWATTQYFEANNIGWSFWPWKKMDTKNTPYSINRPANWQQIIDYSHGKDKPAQAVAQQAFDDLIDYIKLQNCVFYEDVVNSIFRRAPVRIQAENYGHDGYQKSYFVADTSQRSKFYRVNEPVPVELFDFTNNQFWSEQCVQLQKGEWVAYRFGNAGVREAQIRIRVKSGAGNAAFTFTLNGRNESMAVSGQDWQELKCAAGGLRAADNVIRLTVTHGEVLFDWINVQNEN